MVDSKDRKIAAVKHLDVRRPKDCILRFDDDLRANPKTRQRDDSFGETNNTENQPAENS